MLRIESLTTSLMGSKKEEGLMMTEKIEVRHMVPGDAAAWRLLYRGYAAFYKREITDEVLDRTWGWLMDQTHQLEGLVAVDAEGQLLGLAHFRPQPKPLLGGYAGFLDDLFVDPGRRGRGTGRALIARLSEVARMRGWSSIRWITATDNATARRLYDEVALATGWVTYELTP